MPACLHTDLADLDADKKLIITGWGSTTHTSNWYSFGFYFKNMFLIKIFYFFLKKKKIRNYSYKWTSESATENRASVGMQ